MLINTVGFLQTKSEETGQQSSQQVTDRIDIAPKSGQVGTVDGDQVIGYVNITVQANPGADNIDLRNVTVQWADSGGAYRVSHYDVDAGDADFAVMALKDADDSKPVLNDPDDRFILTFDTGEEPIDVTVDTESGASNVDETGTALAEGESVSVRLTTDTGATTTASFSVPETLSGTSSVNL